MNIFYILLGIIVNFIWGLAFFVPYYLQNIDPVLIVLSRYFFYGFISLILLFVAGGHWRSLTRLDWQKAMLFSFAGNLGYYFALVLSIHFAGIVLPALIVGALPVTMMIYSNLKNKEFPFSKLILPIIMIATGVIGLKLLQHSAATVLTNHLSIALGSIFALVALTIWTWYGIANANYLKYHFTILGYTWSLAIGICCLIQVLLFFPVYALFNTQAIHNLFINKTAFYQLILGGIILGVIVSWLATTGWNKVSQHLPTVFIGQLLVFETISSLLYGYIHDRMIPSVTILIFISIALGGIVMGIRATSRRK